MLSDAAHGKDGDERRETALALSLVYAKDPAASLLDEMLRDKDYLVRVAAVDTLGELNDKSRLGLLKTALSDDVPEVAFAAAKALYALKTPEGREALQSVYEGDLKAKSNYVKKEMMNSWRRLKSPKSAFLFTVQQGIGFVPVPGIGAGYNAMMGIFGDAEFSARAVSLLMLCGDRGKACNEMLGAAFSDEDWTVRAAAVHVAATRNLTALKGQLAVLLNDKKEKVRLRAAAGYLRMEAGVPAKALPKKL